MKRLRGLTLYEQILAVTFVTTVLVGLLILQSPTGQKSNGDGTICKGGYKFTGRLSGSVQVIDSKGHGIPCEAQ